MQCDVISNKPEYLENEQGNEILYTKDVTLSI